MTLDPKAVRGTISTVARACLAVITMIAATATASAEPVAAADDQADGQGCPAQAVSVADLAASAPYTIITRFRQLDGTELTRTHQALVNLPTLIDVERPLLLDIGLPDLLVQVTFVPGTRPTLSISKFLTAPVVLPVQVEVVLDIPGSDLGAAFGYDARTSTAPGTFRTAVAFETDPATCAQTIDLGVDVRRPGPDLTLLGALFTEDASQAGGRRDPRAGRLTLAPVPTTTTFGVHIASADGIDTTTATATTTSAPSVTATADVSVADGEQLRHVTGTVAPLPARVSLTHTDEPLASRQTVDYVASTPIATLTALVEERVGDRTERIIDVTAGDVPARMLVELDEDDLVVDGDGVDESGDDDDVPVRRETVHYEADQALGLLDVTVDETPADRAPTQSRVVLEKLPLVVDVTHDRVGVDDPGVDGDERPHVIDVPETATPVGRLEVGFAVDGAVELLDTPEPHYLFAADDEVVDDQRELERAAARVTGLRRAHIETGDRIVADLLASPGPLRALQRLGSSGTRTTDLHVRDLPERVDLSYDTVGKVIEYDASGPIEEITADLRFPPSEPFGVDRGALRLEALPSRLHLDLDEDTADDDSLVTAEVLDGGFIGLLDLALSRTSEPVALLAGGEDGIVEEDLAASQRAHLRITGLQHARSEVRIGEPDANGIREEFREARIVTDPGAADRPFRVRTRTRDRFDEFLDEVVLTPLPDDLTLTSTEHVRAQDDDGDGTIEPDERDVVDARTDYVASETADSLVVDSSQFDLDPSRRLLRSSHVDFGPTPTDGAVPTEVHLCQGDQTGFCTGRDEVTEGLSFRLGVTGDASITMRECQDQGCSGAAETFTVVDPLRLTVPDDATSGFLAVDLDVPPIAGGEKGHVFIDTGGTLVDGHVFVRGRSSDPCADGRFQDKDLTFVDVEADVFFARFEIENLIPTSPCQPTGVAFSDQVGAVECGEGTNFDVNGDEPSGRLANDVCNNL